MEVTHDHVKQPYVTIDFKFVKSPGDNIDLQNDSFKRFVSDLVWEQLDQAYYVGPWSHNAKEALYRCGELVIFPDSHSSELIAFMGYARLYMCEESSAYLLLRREGACEYQYKPLMTCFEVQDNPAIVFLKGKIYPTVDLVGIEMVSEMLDIGREQRSSQR